MEMRLTSSGDAELLSRFYLANADHLRAWVPLTDEDYHSATAWAARLELRELEHAAGVASHFVTYDPQENAIAATCSLTNIVRGPFQACNIGYAVSLTHQGKGVMRRLCQHVIQHAFSTLDLNRVMANYMPENRRSEALLESLGFTREGVARKYLKINGEWEDHVLTSLLNPENG